MQPWDLDYCYYWKNKNKMFVVDWIEAVLNEVCIQTRFQNKLLENSSIHHQREVFQLGHWLWCTLQGQFFSLFHSNFNNIWLECYWWHLENRLTLHFVLTLSVIGGCSRTMIKIISEWLERNKIKVLKNPSQSLDLWTLTEISMAHMK